MLKICKRFRGSRVVGIRENITLASTAKGCRQRASSASSIGSKFCIFMMKFYYKMIFGQQTTWLKKLSSCRCCSLSSICVGRGDLHE